MADENDATPPDVTETGGADAVNETGFPNPDEFEDGDEVDNDTVALPDDSFDQTAAVDEEGC